MQKGAGQIVLFLATGCYSGYFPRAPGTAGTVVAVPLFFLCAAFSMPVYLIITVACVLGAIPLAAQAERMLGRSDPPQVVIDEIAGYLVAMATFGPDWRYAIAGFFVFRVMDIIKPYPAGLINSRMHGGAGIVLDDIVAGLYANMVLQLVRIYFIG